MPQDSLAYNSRLQPASQSAISGSTTYLHLTYDFHLGNSDNGNLYAITNVKDSTRSQSFTYDTLNRILTAKTPNPSSHSWGIGFTIDAFGNLTQTSPISGMTNFPMSVNQQVNTKNQFTLLGYGYDAVGEALDDGLSAGCSGHGYAWNAEGMQSCANGTTYTYDGDEERVKKSNGTLYWGGGAGGALAESDLSGNLTAEYIFFNGQRIAMRNASTHVVSYFVLDHLGSTSVLADAAGNILNDSDYTPYGGEIPFTSGNPAQHYKFTGKERDSETGNDYFGARYFANNMGRWFSPDWSAKVEPVPYSKLADPQSLNLYSYVENNPMMRVDPDGHGCEKASGGSAPECMNAAEKANALVDYIFGGGVGKRPGDSAQQHKAMVIFGETSGLSSEVGKNGKPVTTPGANPSLKTARENVADISARNSGVYSRKPSAAELKNPQVRAAWQASQAAAAASNGSLPGHYFFLRQAGAGRQRPSKAQGWGQGKPLLEYGPFNNKGGGDVPRGNRTYIDIYNR